MAFQISPGVLVTERDLTSIIPAVATTTGGFVGSFAWGPVLDPTLVSSENELAAMFGKPTDSTFASFFSAANFLAYSNSLFNVRVVGNSAANAIAAQAGALLSATVAAAGSGFTDIPTVTISGGTGSGGTATATLKVVTVAVGASGGTGWDVNDTFSVNIGSGTEATFRVDTVSVGGVVTAVSIVGAGNYSDIVAGSLTNVATTDTTAGGTGTGLQVNLALGLNTVAVSGGSYTVAPSLSAGNGSTINSVTLATAASTTTIGNEDDYQGATLSSSVGAFIAKYPGALGNAIRVSMADTGTFTGWAYAAQFDSSPTESVAGKSDGLHIIVIDDTGAISGVAGTVLEKFAYVSKASDARKSDGTNNYYKNVINTSSKYLWWANHVGANWGGTMASVTSFDAMSSALNVKLAGGADGDVPTTGQLQAGWNLLANTEAYDISLMVAGPVNPTVAQWVVQKAEERKDAVAFVSPTTSQGGVILGTTAFDDTISFRENSFIVNTSYGVLDSGWKYQYDRYNDVYRWVPLCGDTAGLCARTDLTNDPWFSPGGFNRGQIKNVVKLSLNPNQAQRDQLYKNCINPVVSFPGQGTILYGDKTLLKRPSAFDRINVRRLFIVLEKAIATAAKFQLFEFNDSATRAQFRAIIEPFLRDVQGRRGITDFRVKCDETNNTGEVIDRNEFIADIFIKPARSINFITLNFIAARTSISFDEIGA